MVRVISTASIGGNFDLGSEAADGWDYTALQPPSSPSRKRHGVKTGRTTVTSQQPFIAPPPERMDDEGEEMEEPELW